MSFQTLKQYFGFSKKDELDKYINQITKGVKKEFSKSVKLGKTNGEFGLIYKTHDLTSLKEAHEKCTISVFAVEKILGIKLKMNEGYTEEYSTNSSKFIFRIEFEVNKHNQKLIVEKALSVFEHQVLSQITFKNNKNKIKTL